SEPEVPGGPDVVTPGPGVEAVADAVASDAGTAMSAPLARRREARQRRPWWARLLGRFLDPWIALKVAPQVPADLVDGRPVCYVLEDYGMSNALILERACREAGLPSPLRPLPGDPLGRKRAYVALSRRNAGGALALATGQAPPKKTHSE